MPSPVGEAIRRLHAIESKIRGLGVRRLALGPCFATRLAPTVMWMCLSFAPNEKTFTLHTLADLLEDTFRVEVITTESLHRLSGPLAEATDVLRAA